MLIYLKELRQLIRQQLSEQILKDYVQLTLIEGKVDDLKLKYPDVDVDALASQDPSRKNKYLEWMVKQMNNGHRIEDLVPTVTYFHNNVQKFKSKDINSYKDLKDLEDEVKNISFNGKQSRGEIKSTAQKVVNSDEWKVIRPETKKACQKYGAGTKWCITMGDADYWEDYTGNNVIFYYFLRKKPFGDKFDKIAVAIDRDENNNIVGKEAFDAADDPIDDDELNELIGEELISQIENDAEAVPETAMSRLVNNKLSGDEINTALQKGLISKQATAENHNTPPEVLRVLAQDENDDVRIYVAENPNVPVDVLKVLAQDENDDVRSYVARNPNTSPETLQILAQDENKYIRFNVARNPNTSPEVLQILAQDKSKIVKLVVAENSNTPVEVLQILAQDEDKDVRLGIVNNSSTSPEILRQLAQDKDEFVRRYIAENSNTPPEVLQVLAQDENEFVRRIAINKLNKL
jgi:hypothetical protein